MKRKPVLTSLSLPAAAIVAAMALGVAPGPYKAGTAHAATANEPAPSTKKKVKKKVRTKKKTRRGKRPRRKQNFGSSSSLEPGLVPQAPPVAFPHLTLAMAQIKAGEYRTAITTLNGLERPDDANVLNLLGFSHRKLGLIDVGMRYYLAALERNPKHKGVHEYLGEAYLQKDDLAKAEVMLKKLGKICGTGCAEYKELSSAIDEYRKQEEL